MKGRKARREQAKPSKKLEEEEEEDREPELSPVDSGDEGGESSGSASSDDLDDDGRSGRLYGGGDDEEEEDDDDDDGDSGDESSSGGSDSFEDQGSSDEDEERLRGQHRGDESDEDGDEIAVAYESEPRSWSVGAPATNRKKRSSAGEGGGAEVAAAGDPAAAARIHADDWSSDEDDEEGRENRIGKVPLHWYDDYEHVGYDAHGSKVVKAVSGDRIDDAIAREDAAASGRYVVRDALNDRDVELTGRQLELIRRVQGGAFAHPEHDANPDYVDYFSGVDPEISGLSSNRTEPKARFQPSRWERMQVERLIERLNRGAISMDYLTGKVRDMNDVNRKDPKKPFLLWSGDEEDELNARKGPQHIAAPKMPPPGHAESYVPPDEYLPTEEDLKKWEDMEPKDRPHGHLVPKKFPNLRSVGAYRHSVREAFERCLDLYLCPRVLKRRLNIDPESLVPRLPRASDLRPFPTTRCIEYRTPRGADGDDDRAPAIRCVAASPDGQFMASGASDGQLRMWEVQSGRLLRSWDLSRAVSGLGGERPEEVEANASTGPAPVVALDWNPNRSHHCLLAAVGPCVVVVATGTAGQSDADVTEALLASAVAGGGEASNGAGAKKAVRWVPLGAGEKRDGAAAISSFDRAAGPVCALRTAGEVSAVRWQAKGDYFLSVSPKAGAAAVLIHQLSRGHSQQPFGKAKGEAQVACFHPNKPFLFVASQQHVRIYHLVKQNMVKRLATGCRWISSLDVHPSGDHLIVGTLDRRVVWFDLDLSATPYKTLKYHERAVRCCRFHGRYPLLASCSDDGTVHVFHSTVYSDLMRNPLVVPVKILRGHAVTDKLGVLAVSFHPSQPWIFTGGADGRIFLFQDI